MSGTIGPPPSCNVQLYGIYDSEELKKEIETLHDFADLINAVEKFLTRFINPSTKLTDYEKRYLNEIRAIIRYMKDEVSF